MIHCQTQNSRLPRYHKVFWDRNVVIHSLLAARNLFNVQTVEYDVTSAYSTDLDPTGNFLLVGLSNGSVDLQGIQDPTLGALDQIARLNLSKCHLNQVQWNPGDEQFFSCLDNHNLYLVDPVELRTVEKFNFSHQTTWSDWNPNDKKMIAVCGLESMTRLVDIRSGSSVQTIILNAQSGHSSHRASNCLWSRLDYNCLIVGDNEGYLHVYDTRHCSKPQLLVGEDCGSITGMSFTTNQHSLITSQGVRNKLVEWKFDKCSLRACIEKFKKREKSVDQGCDKKICDDATTTQASSSKGKTSNRKSLVKKRKQPWASDSFIRCQFYVTDRHIYCPVPLGMTKAKELHIYDIKDGYRIKTLKSDDVFSPGSFTVTGLFPESLAIYVGGRNRLRVWSFDENHQRKMDEKVRKFHQTTWDSDEEL